DPLEAPLLGDQRGGDLRERLEHALLCARSRSGMGRPVQPLPEPREDRENGLRPTAPRATTCNPAASGTWRSCPMGRSLMAMRSWKQATRMVVRYPWYRNS